MELLKLLQENNNIKVELRLSDLVDFANYLLDEKSKSNDNTIPKPDIGDIRIAREVTGLSDSTIYAKVWKREIPFMKMGGKLFFSRKDLTQWIQSGKVNTDRYDELNKYLK